MAKGKNPNRIADPTSDKVFYFINYILLTIALIVVAYPCYFVIVASVSDYTIVNSGKLLLYPEGFNTVGYQKVIEDADIWIAYANTILYTVTNTLLGLAVCILAGYGLSRRDLPFRNQIMGVFVFTMYFSGGLIPFYLLVTNLGLGNTRLLLIILGCTSVYNIIIARSFFASSIPQELQEAAEIDGCGNAKFFVSIVIPLSKPIIAVIGLYIAVAKWNEYFNALIFISTKTKQPLQLILREKLTAVSTVSTDTSVDAEALAVMTEMVELLKYAFIVVATVPILIVYPFIQKYFAKGVMIGSLKG
ncbi:MAG: carbohydrate ABC transporter permease [Clostridia bacterium]